MIIDDIFFPKKASVRKITNSIDFLLMDIVVKKKKLYDFPI